MLAFTFIACKKETDKPQVPVSTAEIDVTPRVRAFIDAARSAAQTKDNATISADSAEWYVEAGLNFTIATAWVECSTITMDSAEVALTGSAEGYNQADVQAAFNTLHQHITGLLVADVNHLVLSDATIVGSGPASTLKVYLQIGSGYEKLNTNFSNSWIWGDDSAFPIAACGCSSNPGSGRCAYKQIQARVNQNIPLIQKDCYWHSIRAIGVMSWESGLFANWSYLDFPSGSPATPWKIFRCQQPESHCVNCWSPALMGTYTQYAWDVLLQLKPSDRQPISCTFDSKYTICQDCSIRFHQVVYRYGKKACLQP